VRTCHKSDVYFSDVEAAEQGFVPNARQGMTPIIQVRRTLCFSYYCYSHASWLA